MGASRIVIPLTLVGIEVIGCFCINSKVADGESEVIL